MNRAFPLIGRRTGATLLACLFVSVWLAPSADAQAPPTAWRVGVSKIDITPDEPVRMAGYGNRDHPSEGIDTPLNVRCLAIGRTDDEAPPALLVSVDTIGLPGSLTDQIAKQIGDQHQTPRERIVFCSTHTHCGPDLVSELSSIFSTPLTDAESAAGVRYKSKLRQGVLDAVDEAISDLAPAVLAHGVGEATFAANRRVLTDGRWTGFGVQLDGPVDHTVPILRVTRPDGRVCAVVFNYACHCTTLGGNHYQINAEWAGYASETIEAAYPDSVALCTIGCGADANPEPRESLDATKLHGRTLAAEVKRIADGRMRPIDADLTTRFDYAALSFELPTEEELKRRLETTTRPQEKRHVEHLLEVYRRDHRLPATYPVPIQAWKFGDQLTMVFLGGEVVVDYALRLKKSLKAPDLWVTAYANDVLGYIASERMRSEGGYEFDRSGVYYSLPGPWAAGTEDLFISRIEELLESRGRSHAISPNDALKSFRIDPRWQVDLVASEPQVQDPVNLAFADDGRLWVVEMGDYPQGEKGGRIKVLRDKDRDGFFESAVVFLDDLAFPTGVQPWGDGVIISAAPDLLWARDSDGDDRADEVRPIVTGFRLANPQHRIGGFTYGLDHSLHCSSGDNLGEIRSLLREESIDASGHDVKLWPDSGRIAAISGRTQFIRSRNDWGQWFGNDNSRPMYHFPIDSAYLKRNPAVSFAANTQMLFDPPVAPPVFPQTSPQERFNDLFAAGRFTSACSADLFRSATFSDPAGDTAFICEPVHNLVHRALLVPHGATFRAARHQDEQASEFLASTDPWFRPVRCTTGPDDALWIVDMYRETIEHPEWIPESWQQRLDLRAGHDRGRIYRVRAASADPVSLPPFTSDKPAVWIESLRSPNGVVRDMAQRRLLDFASRQPSLDDGPGTILASLRALSVDHDSPLGQVHALSILDSLGRLESATLLEALHSEHAGLLIVATRLCESRLDRSPQLLSRMRHLSGHDDDQVVLQVALALGSTDAAAASDALAAICSRVPLDPWVARAVSCSVTPHVATVAQRFLTHLSTHPEQIGDVQTQLLKDLFASANAAGIDLADAFSDSMTVAGKRGNARIRLGSVYASAIKSGDRNSGKNAQLLGPLYGRAIDQISDPSAATEDRCHSLRLLGLGLGPEAEEDDLLLSLLSPANPLALQQLAIDQLTDAKVADNAEALLQRWPTMSRNLRNHVVSRMLVRRPWTEALLSAIEENRVSVADLSAAARQQLLLTGNRSMKVRAARLVRASGSAEKQKLIRTYLDRFDGHSDVNQGQQLFQKHCAVCHVSNGDSMAVGASLDNLSDRRDRALAEAILDPNRAVDPKFQNYLVRTDDDRILAGAIEEEVGSSLTLAHADGSRTTLRRDEIAEMRNSGVSLMPEGLEEVLSPASLEDLIAYLQQRTHPTEE